MEVLGLYDDLPLFSGDLVCVSPLADDLPNWGTNELDFKSVDLLRTNEPDYKSVDLLGDQSECDANVNEHHTEKPFQGVDLLTAAMPAPETGILIIRTLCTTLIVVDGSWWYTITFGCMLDCFMPQPRLDHWLFWLSEPNAGDDDDWMDKRMNLISFLSNPKVQVNIGAPAANNNTVFNLDLNTDYALSAPPASDAKPFELVPGTDQISSIAELLSLDFGDAAFTNNAGYAEFVDEVSDFGTVGLASLPSDEDINAALSSPPILSPVSPQDIESILSSLPSSPAASVSNMSAIDDYSPPALAFSPSLSTVDTATVLGNHIVINDNEYSLTAPSRSGAAGPVRPVRQNRMKKYSPYQVSGDDDDDCDVGKQPSVAKPGRRTAVGKKERKKQQNKDAATRYRNKKKEELMTVFEECDQLEEKNTQLKDRVDSMTREIQYLKDLMNEVRRARGDVVSQP